MESLDVIEKVSMPTPWASSMVTIVLVKHNRTLRIYTYIHRTLTKPLDVNIT